MLLTSEQRMIRDAARTFSRERRQARHPRVDRRGSEKKRGNLAVPP